MKLRAIALTAALAVSGTIGGVAAATTASAAPPRTITATSVQVSLTRPAPNVTVRTFAEYQPSLTAPGYRLYATLGEICLTGRNGNSLCTWRLNPVGAPVRTLTGNAVQASPRVARGQAGLINGGTGIWRGARGVFRSVNIAPLTATDTFTFSTP